MHNLVKDATGIDFLKFGDDVKAAKEVTLKALDSSHGSQNKYAIEACPSVGHVLNEVDLKLLLDLHYEFMDAYINLLFYFCSW